MYRIAPWNAPRGDFLWLFPANSGELSGNPRRKHSNGWLYSNYRSNSAGTARDRIIQSSSFSFFFSPRRHPRRGFLLRSGAMPECPDARHICVSRPDNRPGGISDGYATGRKGRSADAVQQPLQTRRPAFRRRSVAPHGRVGIVVGVIALIVAIGAVVVDDARIRFLQQRADGLVVELVVR